MEQSFYRHPAELKRLNENRRMAMENLFKRNRSTMRRNRDDREEH